MRFAAAVRHPLAYLADSGTKVGGGPIAPVRNLERKLNYAIGSSFGAPQPVADKPEEPYPPLARESFRECTKEGRAVTLPDAAVHAR